jgi:hypothetical protein
MASALQLTAYVNIVNGQGLAANTATISEISAFHNHSTINLIGNIFNNALSSNDAPTLLGSLSSIGQGVHQCQWLLDIYPSNITPVCTGGVTYYGNTAIQTPTPASFSSTVLTQVELPFANGIQGFANVYQSADSYAESSFDTVASVYLLNGKTYSQSGIGYTGPADLATDGIATAGALISNIVAKWGTMYDVNNIATFSDPYIFGQNLLNQGLGVYGNLSAKLTAAGLNVDNLSQVPQSGTTVNQQATTYTTTSTLGPIELPTIANVVTTTSVTGNSPDVVTAIYQSITGADLEAIVTAANIKINSSVSITTLEDYLNFNKIIDPVSQAELSRLTITDFPGLSSFIQSKIGQGYFKSWADLSDFLQTLEVPTLKHTTTTSTSTVLSNSAVTQLNSATGVGSGPFNNPILTDYLGATSGDPYLQTFTLLNQNYNQVITSAVTTAVSNLDQAVVAYNNALNANLTPSPIDSYVSSVNTALNSIGSTTASIESDVAYYQMLNKLSNEVTNISHAGLIFNAGTPQVLKSFAKRIGQIASDKTQFNRYQFFTGLITNDVYGDSIRSAVSETINIQKLNSKGITVSNDPNPGLLLTQAQQQNIPLSTYINQNK